MEQSLGALSVIGKAGGTGPHAGGSLYHLGAPLTAADAVVILIHGRGASAESILSLAPYLHSEGVAFVAPQAVQQTWYPYSFLMPKAQNEPYLSSALSVVAATVALVGEQSGLSLEKIVIGGFSQGACLASEFVARNPQRYGGLIAFSGGLIGPLNEPLDHSGDLLQTPVFIGCSDVDGHIPLERVEDTARVLEGMNGQVDKRIYPGMDHTVNQEEVAAAQAMIAEVTA